MVVRGWPDEGARRNLRCGPPLMRYSCRTWYAGNRNDHPTVTSGLSVNRKLLPADLHAQI